ncbi:hypothetical protein BKA65DRAFT_553187 [Rhexocercosporidium sp. MPI-PUGE-AT-0058]|nr:hypothetical protein BKA65DRAFT_553187 [Rhexocercosporidium sp. MPI-PUGE-AT-0058]
MAAQGPPNTLPPGNIQNIPGQRAPPRNDVLLAWKVGQARSDPPTDYLAIGKRKASATNLSLLPPDSKQVRIDKKTTAAQQRTWLNSNLSWNAGKLDQSWTGIKVLGIGGNGVAGLWQKTTANGIVPPTVESVVVKQIGTKDGALNEARFMERFKNGAGVQHVVKLKGGPYSAGVLGMPNIDPLNAPISRIYLEYCEEGDIKYSAGNPMPEDLVWQIFKCLALALAACAHGTESPGSASWGIELVHFDIKPDNSFAAERRR